MLLHQGHHEIDEVFYPVNYDGSPLAPGIYQMNWQTYQGKEVCSYVTPGNGFDPTKDEYLEITKADGKFKVTWYNQTFPKESRMEPPPLLAR